MPYAPKRFFGGNSPNAANTELYRVPAGRRAILTQWEAIPTTAPSRLLSLYVAGLVSPHGGNLMHQKTIAQPEIVRMQGFYVMYAGDGPVVSQSVTTDTWHYLNGVEGDEGDLFEGGTPVRALLKTTTTGDSTLYTVPTGRTLVVKTLVASNIAGVQQSLAFRIGAAPIAHGWFASIPAGSTEGVARQVDGSWLALGGETIIVNQSEATTDGVAWYMGGVLY